MKTKKHRNVFHGFSLMEVMIVVLIIGILLAVAVPNFYRAREGSRTKACVGNLVQIDSAKVQWAMDYLKLPGATVTAANCAPYLKGTPVCQSGGAYNYTTVGASPTCSKGGTHVLP